MDVKLIEVPPQTVDDFGDVVKLRDAFAPTERLYQKLRSQLVELAAAGDPKAEFVVRGERYTLRISPCSMESKPDVALVRKKLGATVFVQIAQITKRALEGFLLKHEIDELCITTQTGSRSYSAIPISRVGMVG